MLDKRLVIGIALALGAMACQKKETSNPDSPAKESNIGSQAADVSWDTGVIRGVNASAGDLVRNTGDCDKVHQAAPEAKRALDEAYAKIRTAAGRVSLDNLKKQIDNALNMCP